MNLNFNFTFDLAKKKCCFYLNLIENKTEKPYSPTHVVDVEVVCDTDCELPTAAAGTELRFVWAWV